MPGYRKVILDTNFLMIPGLFGVDIFRELPRRLDFPFRLHIVSQTLDELDSIAEKGSKRDRVAAQIAKQLIKAKKINIIDYAPDKYADDALLELSEQEDVYIATQDRELKRRIKKKKIILRQKKYIELV